MTVFNSSKHGVSLADRQSLWLHGGGLTGDTWAAMCADLPRAEAPDLPGHGAAPALANPRVEGYAAALQERLQPGAILIGHSLGGMVALELAARSPFTLGALILVEAVPKVRDRWVGRIGPQIARPFLQLLPPAWLGALSCFGQSEAARAEILRTVALASNREVLETFDAARLYDGRRHLASIKIPALVVVGRRNTATHRGARLVARSIAGARFEMIEGGHLLHIDNPQGLRRTIDTFLTQCAGNVHSGLQAT